MRTRALAVLGALATCVLALATSAVAAKPDVTTIPVDETNIINCGGYQVEESVQGTITIRSFSRDGELVREITSYSLVHTFTNPDTGESVTTPDVGIDFVRFEQDGAFTVAIIGIVGRITVPGEGLVVADLGRIVLFFEGPDDEEPEIVFDAGKHQDLTAGICEALAP